jgi:secreted PhoX family phosphatase
VRKLVERRNDPTATSFAWIDYAVGGPVSAGGSGMDSPDNLVFDSQENLWVMTDISTGSLNSGVHAFHANNAAFMIPTQGENAGVAFRFANLPREAEGTGPYFSPDESTLFINVQHPGEQAGVLGSAAVFGQPSTYTSYWPRGNKTAESNPSEPIPATVAVTRVKGHKAKGSRAIPRRRTKR